MKKPIYIPLLVSSLVAGAALTAVSCSDEWDKHYDNDGVQMATDAPTLLEQVMADDELKPFLRVLQAVEYGKQQAEASEVAHYSDLLASSQVMTLWAPVITDAQADSVIAIFQADRAAGRKSDDNRAVTQFIQNHLALYGRSVSTQTNDTVRMLNGKYMHLLPQSLNGVEFKASNIIARNGIMYKLAHSEMFSPNVREYMALHSELDSVAAYFELFDKDVLNESASVQQGIVDGKIVYADSVMNRSNQLQNMLGAFFNREDSAYLFFAPTNDVWTKEFADYRPLFNYVDRVENRDSVGDLNARMAIVRGRVFNLNSQKGGYQDSIKNTSYINQNLYYGLNVFKNPLASDGIFGGLDSVRCSNGLVIEDPQGRIDPALTFKQVRYILGSDNRHRITPQLTENNQKVPRVTITPRSVIDSVRYNGQLYKFDQLENSSYVEIAPIDYGTKGTSYRNSGIYFTLPSTFSNTYYNVYLITVPAYANAAGYSESQVRPTRFKVSYNQRRMTARRESEQTSDPNDDIEFDKNDTKISPDAKETHVNGSTYFQTSGDQVDVICIDRARLATVSGYNAFGSVSATQRYFIETDIRATDLTKNNQTNVLRINRIIYVPFATKEEAEAFDIDLSNLKEYRE
ncbi:MAG: hypothetical protein J5486_06235 [Bacteroidaceae bacterium]|nr:hypothetical protein [Bacteroidaceae bacterium]